MTKYIPYNDSLFLSSEWLDAVCDQWSYITHQDLHIPVSIEKKMGMKLCRNFHLTPAVPIQDAEVAHALYDYARKIDLLELDLSIHPEQIKVSGDYIKPMRTQILNLREEINFNKNRSREITKYESAYHVDTSNNYSRLEDFIKKHLKEKNVSFTIPSHVIARATEYLIKNDRGTIVDLFHKDQLIATCLLAIDHHRCYNLICASDKKFTGAMTLLMKSAIDWARNRGCTYFDFEGSMDDGVNNYYKSFGTIEAAYSRITVINNPILRLVKRYIL